MLCGNISVDELVNRYLMLTGSKNKGFFVFYLGSLIDIDDKFWYYIYNKSRQNNKVIYMIEIPRPSKEEVIKYLNKWDSLENYVLQENALDNCKKFW